MSQSYEVMNVKQAKLRFELCLRPALTAVLYLIIFSHVLAQFFIYSCPHNVT